MADVVSPTVRSRMMSGIKGKNTKPELVVRSFLHRAGFRYRLHDSHLPGKPDIVLKRYESVVFVHGCFWHQHANCSKASMPSSNSRFWKAKLLGNVERDTRNKRKLVRAGWKVHIVWECDLSDAKLGGLAKKIRANLEKAVDKAT